MSNLPYGVPSDQGTPWPQYGDNGAEAPMQGMPMQGMPMQGGPQDFQGYGGPAPMPIARGPSKVLGAILIVPDVLASFTATLIPPFILWFQGITDMANTLAQGTTFSSDGTAEVDGTGGYILQTSGGEATTCKTIGLGNNVYDMSPFQSSGSLYYISGPNSGTYMVHCKGVNQKAPMTGISVSPSDFTNTAGFIFLWSTVVGVTGVVPVLYTHFRAHEIR